MFVGRKDELSRLNSLYQTEKFQMVVVYGRRRVGKTSLLVEFTKKKRTLFFTALEQADKDNLADFSSTIFNFFNIPITQPFSSWAEAFDFVAQQAQKERFILVFDELPYAAEKNPALPSVIQVAIDHKLKQTGLFMILCGSNQGFMESNVLGLKSPLYGRRTAQIKLSQLSATDAAKMVTGTNAQDKFAYYACFGGVPYYLEQIDTAASFEQNLRQLYFDPTGFLFDEPYGLLRQEFSDPAMYNSILRAIAGGANRPNLIADQCGINQTSLPKYLKALIDVGIVEKIVPFGENPERSKKGLYRISDACFDFWFKFVMPKASDIEQGMGRQVLKKVTSKQLDDYLGRRFERLCAEWLRERAIQGELSIDATQIGTWWGADKELRLQTDIDVLAADVDEKKLLICECKYRNSFNETDEINKLLAKGKLISEYSATGYILFSKHAISSATAEKYSQNKQLGFITLEEIYK